MGLELTAAYTTATLVAGFGGYSVSRAVESDSSFIKIFLSSYLNAQPRVLFPFSPSFPVTYLVKI